ncbi:hypothetical protein HW555_010438 [Spodoptera exigua]|uniref:Uncharacterized protein n=1 Tax=Spodoptera exigua TaxID=7107 RepID=A0A835GB42_SPOEX|nr:hypothetical protein HW555_010438 [Spodoptera exigua]
MVVISTEQYLILIMFYCDTEKQAVDPIEESLETPRGTQPAGVEESSTVKDSSSTGARLLTTDRKLTLRQHTFDAKAARLNLKKRLDLNTWREELARRDDDHIVNLQPNARPNIATTSTVMVTPMVTKKKMSPKSQKIPISASQDTLETWTVRNNLRRRFDLNSWRQPQEKKEEASIREKEPPKTLRIIARAMAHASRLEQPRDVVTLSPSGPLSHPSLPATDSKQIVTNALVLNKETRRECETQAVEQIAESLEIPRETQSAGAELYSALKDSYSSSAGAQLLRTDLSSSQHTLDAKREELARRDDDKVRHLQPHVATTRTETVTSAATKKQMPPRPLKTPMSAGQDTLDIWTVRNNLRRRYDLNSWRQP